MDTSEAHTDLQRPHAVWGVFTIWRFPALATASFGFVASWPCASDSMGPRNGNPFEKCGQIAPDHRKK